MPLSFPHRVALGAGILFAIMEIIDAFRIEFPLAALISAALVLAATAWGWRRRAGLVALAALMTLELLLVVFAFGGLAELTNPTSLANVLIYLAFIVVSLIGAVAATLALRRRAPSPAMTAQRTA